MKAVRICMAVCIGFFLFGLIGSIRMLRAGEGSKVEILQDGEVLYTFDPAGRLHEERIEIVCEAGSNIVMIGPKGVCVESADCADQVCVEAGYLKSEALPIICLPHRLTVRYADDEEAEAELDGVSG